ncbi:hypothetical protein [Rhizobium sp. HT1-10]|uniref:hypothetical protein n=1 Tax=Rhizobium sp. HT1-10 TaxID=3111638 RepID=UPI003C27640A
MKSLIPALTMLAAFVPVTSHAEALKDSDIRSDIIGRTIYLAAPLGGEMPLTYHKSGTVDGNGQAVGLGKFIKPNDVGKWWIKSNQLCQQFKTWYDGAPMCFVLERDSADKVKWTRDNGQTGVARIGD